MPLTKAEYLKPAPFSGPHTVDGLGDVYIRRIPFDQALHIQQAAGTDGILAAANLAIAVVCDADGERVFSRDDLPAILAADMDKLNPLFELVNRHSGVPTEAMDATLGNSETTTLNGSGTA